MWQQHQEETEEAEVRPHSHRALLPQASCCTQCLLTHSMGPHSQAPNLPHIAQQSLHQAEWQPFHTAFKNKFTTACMCFSLILSWYLLGNGIRVSEADEGKTRTAVSTLISTCLRGNSEHLACQWILQFAEYLHVQNTHLRDCSAFCEDSPSLWYRQNSGHSETVCFWGNSPELYNCDCITTITQHTQKYWSQIFHSALPIAKTDEWHQFDGLFLQVRQHAVSPHLPRTHCRLHHAVFLTRDGSNPASCRLSEHTSLFPDTQPVTAGHQAHFHLPHDHQPRQTQKGEISTVPFLRADKSEVQCASELPFGWGLEKPEVPQGNDFPN